MIQKKTIAGKEVVGMVMVIHLALAEESAKSYAHLRKAVENALIMYGSIKDES